MAPLVSGPIFQVAWVVDDIAASERWFTETLGVPRWLGFDDVEFGPETCTYRGAPADFAIHVRIGYAGGQQLELIQPTRGASIYTEHLERSGPGLHHFAYLPDDFEAGVADAEQRGLEVVQRGMFGESGLEFAYLDAAAGGASYLELVRMPDELRAYLDSFATKG